MGVLSLPPECEHSFNQTAMNDLNEFYQLLLVDEHLLLALNLLVVDAI